MKRKSIKEENYFEDMETAFGVEHKHKNMDDEEKGQFGDMEEVEMEKPKNEFKAEKPHADSVLDKSRKEAGKDAVEYYKSIIDKMAKNQKSNVEMPNATKIGESKEDNALTRLAEEFEAKKYNIEDDEHKMYYGSGMEGLRYDSDGTKRQEEFDERNEAEGPEESTEKKLEKDGENYKKYKYGEEKYKESEDEYQETPRVRVTKGVKTENTMKYADVIKENIFKAKGKLVSEEQVIKLANKVPTRVKLDETVFAITDGDNSYRLIWEGEEDGKPVITHHKNNEMVNEDIDKMKSLWGFKSSDVISTKKNITESTNDVFKKMLNKVKESDGLLGNEE